MKAIKWAPVVFRSGADGVVDARKFRAKCQRPKFVADCLARYRSWRRGEGEYEFSEIPAGNAPQPFCPRALSIIEEEAVRMLVELHGLLLEKRRSCKQ